MNNIIKGKRASHLYEKILMDYYSGRKKLSFY